MFLDDLRLYKSLKMSLKATWDDSSESEMEEDNQEVANLCLMALEDNEVPSMSNFLNYDSLDYDDDDADDDDDENSIVHKLMDKCKKLFSKKKFYKQEFSKLSKEFEALKDRFSQVMSSNEKLENELKNSTSFQYEFDKCKIFKRNFRFKRFNFKISKRKRNLG